MVEEPGPCAATIASGTQGQPRTLLAMSPYTEFARQMQNRIRLRESTRFDDAVSRLVYSLQHQVLA